MKKILLTCFLALPCLFQKARIKLNAKKEHLGFPSPSTAPRCDVLIKYLAVGVSHVAKRSVSRSAYLRTVISRAAISHRPLGGLFRAAYFALACLAPAYFAPGVFHPAKRSVFRAAYFQSNATWIGTYALILSLLCSSTSPTLSKSAQSPLEPPLHRSAVPVSPHSGDTHRGEETLSDTFTQVDYGAEVSSPANYTTSLTTLDGGPMLLTSVYGLPASLNFGLINPDQDMGAGEVTSGLQPAPSPVFTLKGVIKSIPTEKYHLSYRLSTQEIDRYYGKAQLHEDSIHLVPGSLYAGTSGRQVFEVQIPIADSFGRLSIYDGDSPWLEDIWVRAGDSLQIHQEGTRIFFSGPSAESVRIQLRLQELFAVSMAELNPVMILSDASAMLNTPAKLEAYQNAVDSYVPGWSRHMVWLESEEDKLNRAKELFSIAGERNLVLTTLEQSKDILNAELYRWLYGYWKGRLATQALRFAAIAKPVSADWASLIMEHSSEAKFTITQQGKASAELVEALYLENKLLSALTPVSFLHLSESLPDPLEEQVNALYLVREYKELTDGDSLFRQVINKTQSPEILLTLEQIYRSGLKGREFASFAFVNEADQPVFPEEWKGKLVLIDFWLSGCGACLKFAKESFLPLLKEFQDHSGLMMVTVSGDSNKELWKQSLASGKYSNDQAVNLFSGGTSHPTLRENLIQSFPAQLLLDREGKILQTGGFPDNRQAWIDLIQYYLDESSPGSQSTHSNTFSHFSPKPY